jgi:hypothetical protein
MSSARQSNIIAVRFTALCMAKNKFAICIFEQRVKISTKLESEKIKMGPQSLPRDLYYGARQ